MPLAAGHRVAVPIEYHGPLCSRAADADVVGAHRRRAATVERHEQIPAGAALHDEGGLDGATDRLLTGRLESDGRSCPWSRVCRCGVEARILMPPEKLPELSQTFLSSSTTKFGVDRVPVVLVLEMTGRPCLRRPTCISGPGSRLAFVASPIAESRLPKLDTE